MKQLLAAVLLAFFALAAPAAAQTFPANNGSPVVDQAGILTPAQQVDLKSKAEALYAQTGRAFAVATVKSLEGYSIDDYAYRLGRAWGLGQKGKDNGVLLLVAPNERKVWIATGYGAGAYMTDAMSGVIIREQILPHFKQSRPIMVAGSRQEPTRSSSRCRSRRTRRRKALPPQSRRSSVASIRAAARFQSSSG